MGSKFTALFIILLFLHEFHALLIIEPQEIAGVYNSAFISFNKLIGERSQNLTGFLHNIILPINGKCELPNINENLREPKIAIVLEANITKNCNDGLHIFYRQLENNNFSAVIVGVNSFYLPVNLQEKEKRK